MKNILICWMMLFSLTAYTQVETYTYAEEVPVSTVYKVYVNRQQQPVIHSPVPASYVAFGMEEAVRVEIEVAHDVKWVDVRPKSAGIAPRWENNRIFLLFPNPVS
ncbi:MAG: hypothetical protein LUG51_17375 [Tannerellaceae bacterium]|nr:hypothetical protein [Tannerellaceae bacterium]